MSRMHSVRAVFCKLMRVFLAAARDELFPTIDMPARNRIPMMTTVAQTLLPVVISPPWVLEGEGHDVPAVLPVAITRVRPSSRLGYTHPPGPESSSGSGGSRSPAPRAGNPSHRAHARVLSHACSRW